MTGKFPANCVAPSFHNLLPFAGTHGPEVAEVARLAGFDPDPEQALALDQIFAFDSAGAPVAFETGIVACRQNLKTGLFKQAALGWLFITEEPLVVWSAHEFRTSQESFRDMCELIENAPVLAREVKAMPRGNGDEAIVLKSGARLIFKARTAGGGRGLSAEKVVLDEAFALRPAHMGALLPTLAARKNPQVVYGSSAGKVDSDVLRAIRDRGRAGGDGRLAYLEWGDPDPGGCEVDGCDHSLAAKGCALDDPVKWAAANPALGRRITEDSLRAFRQALPPEEFAREFMGWWDEPAVNADDLTGEMWASVETEAAPYGEIFMSVDVSPNHAWASIAACGSGVVELVDRRRGSTWLTERMIQLRDDHKVAAFGVDPAGPVASLIPEFERAGLPLRLFDSRDTVRACAALVAAVGAGTMSHRGEPELFAAIGGASKRAVGDGWKWSRKDSLAEITALVAVTNAHWLFVSRSDVDLLNSIW